MGRSRHPNKEIEAALDHAERLGWTVEKSNGHAWGRLLCAHHDQDGCQFSIWSTPRSPENFARQILRKVGKCPHQEDAEDDEEDDDAGA